MTDVTQVMDVEAAAEVQPLPQGHNIVAVASGKGGVGKTWLSITLAMHIARSGRRVLLFDGDIGLANIDVQLGLTPKKDLASVFAGKAKLSEAVMPYENEQLDIIAGRSGSGGFGTLGDARLEAVKRELLALAPAYDLVIIDLGAGVEQHVRSLSAIARRCLVVLTDEPTSMTDAYAFIKLTHAKSPHPDMQIVINQATTLKEGERTYAAISKVCQSFLHFTPPCAGIIRRDTKVKDAIRSQKPIIIKSPGATAAVDAAALSVKLMVKD